MLMAVKFLGVYMIAMGVIILITPGAMEGFLSFFMKGNRIYIAGIFRLLVGVLFLLAVSQSRLKGVILALGILTFAGGILLFVLERSRIRAMVAWIKKRPSAIIRLWGLVAVGVGALIIYAA